MENWVRAMLAMNMMTPLMGPHWSSMNGIAIIPTPQLPCAHRGSTRGRAYQEQPLEAMALMCDWCEQ